MLRYSFLLLFSASLFLIPSCKKDKKSTTAATLPSQITAYDAALGETITYTLVYNEDGTLQSLATTNLDIVKYTYHGTSIVANSVRGGLPTEYDSTLMDAAGKPVSSMHRDIFGDEHWSDFSYTAGGHLEKVTSRDGSDYPYIYYWDVDELTGVDGYP